MRFLLWIGRYAAQGVISYVAPRILAFFLPLDAWIGMLNAYLDSVDLHKTDVLWVLTCVFFIALAIVEVRWRPVERVLLLFGGNPSRQALNQSAFPLWEAACILDNKPLQRHPTGQAAAYLHQLKVYLFERQFGRNLRRFKMPDKVRATGVDNTSDSQEISRAALKAFAAEKGIKVKGLTNDR